MSTAEMSAGRRVLLIGWDAADWKMIDRLVAQGLMPNTARLLRHGVRGNIASLTPMLSPLLWTSIATGKHADRHGVLGFCEPDGEGGVRPVTSTTRQCRALWNIISEAGRRAGAIGWFASHPAEPVNGFVVSDRFAHPAPKRDDWVISHGMVHPAELAPRLEPHRVHPADITPEQVAPFMPLLSEIDDAVHDPGVRALRSLLAHTATVHGAATALMQEEPWDFLGIYYESIDRFAHEFMEYHPPRMAHVDEAAFARYRDVMDMCYRYHDMMLGRLLELAGDDVTTIIVSDHGFHCDEQRPPGTSAIADGQPVAWHRPYGVFIAHGPGILEDEEIYGASLLDVAPTVLALMGLPVPDDMDGHAMPQILASPPDVARIPTYETTPFERPEGAGDDPWVMQQMLEQLQQLGYVEDQGTESAMAERDCSLAQVYLTTGRPVEAERAFRAALARRPDDVGLRVGVANAVLAQGRLDEAEALGRELVADDADVPRASMLLGMIAARRGDTERALSHLAAVEQTERVSAPLFVQVGGIHLGARAFDEAESYFHRAVEIDPDCAEALDGLGVIERARGHARRAVELHMRSAALLHYRPQTHVNLGIALAEVGRINWAARAFEVALEIAPGHLPAQHCLAELCAGPLGEPERAAALRAELAAQQSRAGDA